MLLYGTSARSLSVSPRLEKNSSIQRIFLLYITGSYRTTPTAALQTITAIMPLHLKAQQEASHSASGRVNGTERSDHRSKSRERNN
ncbi:hypothetical protein AVEN_141520-1 [Araneus ventricosus]|uniref:Uncharacterized protein n=1 Tax=Araneus ventricosus TaxID=182803 RepID=A0A4Y2VBG0_ARAVE|nr:hypothetical protein AVEN_141520-1 [Araneus ventricosus]